MAPEGEGWGSSEKDMGRRGLLSCVSESKQRADGNEVGRTGETRENDLHLLEINAEAGQNLQIRICLFGFVHLVETTMLTLLLVPNVSKRYRSSSLAFPPDARSKKSGQHACLDCATRAEGCKTNATTGRRDGNI